MAVEIRHRPHYTWRDYEHWEGRWELIQGLPYAMSPQPSIRHQEVTGRIHALLLDALQECAPCRPLLPIDWKLSEDTVLQPDNLVVCADVSGQYLTVPPVLIFEVLSPATAYKDRNVKYALYEEQGVRHYVLVDPEAESAELFELKDGRYEKRRDVKEEAVTFDLGECQITVDAAGMWQR